VEEQGLQRVLEVVGQEPNGGKFNEMTLNSNGLPHNPKINAGALSICSLLSQGRTQTETFSKLTGYWQRLAGGRKF
jgi:glutaminase